MDGQERARRLAATQDRVITRAQCFACGLDRHTVDQLVGSGRWRRIAPRCYLVGADDPSSLARVRAVSLSLGPEAVAVLGTAAELYGLPRPPGSTLVHMSLPPARARRLRHFQGLRLHQLALPADRVGAAFGIPATTPLATLADLLLRCDRDSAVSAVDAALRQKVIGAVDLALLPSMLRGRRGAVAARARLRLADGRAESRLETRVRLRLLDAGLTAPVLQAPIRDDNGRLVARADFAWPQARLVVEADGAACHSGPEAVFADRVRQNRIVNAGWRLLRFTWQDLTPPTQIPTQVHRALSQTLR
ncbi:type IV toxin-antitoxin system AbiEi family antitoxin domain-containing protein [Pilimelia columellifera]|uniref:Type IV toxin-antitoxin system AbiEi family antitoxin domain-containing protein n=1 Tax=Pilimelia columellifera subsp. columellifera TaxID=706583 RepID=A0ABN3N1F0_9ACTN